MSGFSFSGLGGGSDQANKKRSLLEVPTAPEQHNAPSNLSAPKFSFGSIGQSQNQNPPNTNAAPQAPNQSVGAGQPNQQQSGGIAKDSPAYFNTLLERGRKRAHPASMTTNGRLGQMPGLSFGLEDIARRAQEIGQRGRESFPTDGISQSNARSLLGASGVQPGKALKDFQKLGVDVQDRPMSTETFEPDNAKFIRGIQQRGRDAMFRESMDRVNREFDNFLEETLAINFDDQRQRIMEHFGLVPKSNGAGAQDDINNGSFSRSTKKSSNIFAESAGKRSMFNRSGLEKSLLGTPGLGSSTTRFFGDEQASSGVGSTARFTEDRFIREKEAQFAEKTKRLSQARDQRAVFPILAEFASVEENASGHEPKEIKDAYHALREITGEKTSIKDASNPKAIKERQYKSEYLDDIQDSRRSLAWRKRVIDGSRRYLEKSFYQQLQEIVDRNPKEAQVGGQPTVTNIIRAYIRVRAGRRDLAADNVPLQQTGDHGDYCWILIFYLLRCGFVNEAAEYVQKDEAFKSTDRRFIAYMREYAANESRLLSKKTQSAVNGEYQQRTQFGPDNSVDPYRMACYMIIGRCDLVNRNLNIQSTTEDWMWLQFALARELDRAQISSDDLFGLDQICETVQEIGQKHFTKGSEGSAGGYGIYFMLQILAGMFEHAVKYLHEFAPASAVHFAISLAYYGMLRASNPSVAGNELREFNMSQLWARANKKSVTETTTGLPQINFAALLAYYTPPFRTADPLAAVSYLSLICLNSDITGALGTIQTDCCHEALRQLCLETREYALLLGDIRTDGSRIPGAIEKNSRLIQLDTHQDFLQAVTVQAAALADERGQIADAILLYHLSEDFDSVVQVLNRALADAVTIDLGTSPVDVQPLKPREQDSTAAADLANSSLSLVTSTSAVSLGQTFLNLYNRNAMISAKISPANRSNITSLLRMLLARQKLESNPTNPDYAGALDVIADLNILPVNANGAMPLIRSSATAFQGLDPLIARASGSVLLWTLTCISRQNERLEEVGVWEGNGAGGNEQKESLKKRLAQMARDLMVWAGMEEYILFWSKKFTE
ncbi:MAG: hypothetical protein Q9160_008603 [Pyrenula sp. 1 TL-2023]